MAYPRGATSNISVLVKFVITMGFFWLLSTQIEFGNVIRSLKDMSILHFGFSTLLCSVCFLLGAKRWGMICSAIGFNSTFFENLKIYLAGLFTGQVLFGAIGMDALRSLVLSRRGATPTQIIMLIAVDRLSPMFVALVTLATLAFFWLVSADTVNFRQITEGLRTLGLNVDYAALLMFSVAGISIISLASIFFIKKYSTKLATAVAHLLNANLLFKVVLLAFGFNLFCSAQIFVIGQGLNIQIGFTPFLVLFPLIAIAQMLPFSLAGWGPRELVVVLFLGIYSVEMDVAVLISVIFAIQNTLIALPGGFYLIGLHSNSKPLKERS